VNNTLEEYFGYHDQRWWELRNGQAKEAVMSKEEKLEQRNKSDEGEDKVHKIAVGTEEDGKWVGEAAGVQHSLD